MFKESPVELLEALAALVWGWTLSKKLFDNFITTNPVLRQCRTLHAIKHQIKLY